MDSEENKEIDSVPSTPAPQDQKQEIREPETEALKVVEVNSII